MATIIRVIFLFLLLPSLSFAQKNYIWCPSDFNVPAREHFQIKDSIDLVITDGRASNNNDKVECSADDVTDNIKKLIVAAYPAIKFKILSAEYFYKEAAEGRRTIKILLSNYSATFTIRGTGGRWKGTTKFDVSILDKTAGRNEKITKEIRTEYEKGNTGGFITAKRMLNTSFKESVLNLFSFIDMSMNE